MLCNGVEIKAGQFWEDGCGQRYKIDHVSTCQKFLYPVMAFAEDMSTCSTFTKDGKYIVNGTPDCPHNLETYLPDCTGFDWVAPPVQKYRDMAPEELVEEGDEFRRMPGNEWCRSGNWHCMFSRKSQSKMFTYRRPINPPAVRTHPEYWLSPALTDADNIAYIQRRPDVDAKYEAVGIDGTVMFTLSHRSPDWTVLFEDEAKARLTKMKIMQHLEDGLKMWEECARTKPHECFFSEFASALSPSSCTSSETESDDDLNESDDDFVSAYSMYVAAEDIEVGDLVYVKEGYAYPVHEDDDDEDDDGPVEDEYLYLVNGDVIEAGDEYKAGECWKPFQFEVGRAAFLSPDSVYRRKITGVFPRWYRCNGITAAAIVRNFNDRCCAYSNDGFDIDFDWTTWHDNLVEEGTWIPCTERAAKAAIK